MEPTIDFTTLWHLSAGLWLTIPIMPGISLEVRGQCRLLQGRFQDAASEPASVHVNIPVRQPKSADVTRQAPSSTNSNPLKLEKLQSSTFLDAIDVLHVIFTQPSARAFGKLRYNLDDSSCRSAPGSLRSSAIIRLPAP